jgi:natural product precursor
MKKLTKLNINPEKVMKSEELITLRGGYGSGYCTCRDDDDNILDGWFMEDCDYCYTLCRMVFPQCTSAICVG